MPRHSRSRPGSKPGVSTNVTIGRLNASHHATNRAALRDASMSSVPARCCGWFATMPTGRPSSVAEPVTRFGAYCGAQLEERVGVDDVVDDGAHVVRRGRPVGDRGRRDRRTADRGGSSRRRSAADRRDGGRGGTTRMSRERVARGVLVGDDERRRRRCAGRAPRAPPSSSRVTCTPVNSATDVGPGDVRERVARSSRPWSKQPERERRPRHARAGDREQRRHRRPTRATSSRASRPHACSAATLLAQLGARRVELADERDAQLAGELHRPLDGRAARDADRAVVLAARDAEPHDLPAVDLADLGRRRRRRRARRGSASTVTTPGAKISVTLWPPNPNEFDSAGAGASGARRAGDDVELDVVAEPLEVRGRRDRAVRASRAGTRPLRSRPRRR